MPRGMLARGTWDWVGGEQRGWHSQATHTTSSSGAVCSSFLQSTVESFLQSIIDDRQPAVGLTPELPADRCPGHGRAGARVEREQAHFPQRKVVVACGHVKCQRWDAWPAPVISRALTARGPGLRATCCPCRNPTAFGRLERGQGRLHHREWISVHRVLTRATTTARDEVLGIMRNSFLEASSSIWVAGRPGEPVQQTQALSSLSATLLHQCLAVALPHHQPRHPLLHRSPHQLERRLQSQHSTPSPTPATPKRQGRRANDCTEESTTYLNRPANHR